MKILKSSTIGVIVLFVIGVIGTATLIIKQNMTDIMINDNISQITQMVKYKTPVEAGDGLFLEDGNKTMTPSTTNGLFGELKKQFPAYEVTLRKNLTNSELIDAIYMSLSDNMPVLCLMAAYGEEDPEASAWSAYLGTVAEMDVFGDKITLKDPGGRENTYSVREFLRAARFDSPNTDLFLKLKFALEMFTKNTVFIFEKKPLS